jgi:hypothetical protein
VQFITYIKLLFFQEYFNWFILLPLFLDKGTLISIDEQKFLFDLCTRNLHALLLYTYPINTQSTVLDHKLTFLG